MGSTPPPLTSFAAARDSLLTLGGSIAKQKDASENVEKMPKQSPVASELDRPFWDACNEGRLIIQNCTLCNRLQHPPEYVCYKCGLDGYLEWREVSGRGTIYSYGVIHDTPVELLKADEPFNLAVISLEEDPLINMLSHLPGTPVDQVTIGASVQVVFETTPATGQKVPEWQVVP